MSMETTEEQQQRAKILIEQADLLLVKLAVDVSEVPTRDPIQEEPWRSLPPIFASAEDAYDRLTCAEKRIKDRTVWERTKEASGRTGDDIRKCLHDLHEEIKPFDKG
jgi:hypothetical protein